MIHCAYSMNDRRYCYRFFFFFVCYGIVFERAHNFNIDQQRTLVRHTLCEKLYLMSSSFFSIYYGILYHIKHLFWSSTYLLYELKYKVPYYKLVSFSYHCAKILLRLTFLSLTMYLKFHSIFTNII